jgi:cyclopropane fatty-acyl-phospholipid synthase-like methyltransferase
MPATLSPRLQAIVDALPLKPGLRVLEIGCGPGAMARAIAGRIAPGHVLAIDRSVNAIALARRASQDELRSGVLELRQLAIEDFALHADEPRFDIAVAIRVGVLDGRHPEQEDRARRAIAAALKPRGRLFIDGGKPLREVALARGGRPLHG